MLCFLCPSSLTPSGFKKGSAAPDTGDFTRRGTPPGVRREMIPGRGRRDGRNVPRSRELEEKAGTAGDAGASGGSVSSRGGPLTGKWLLESSRRIFSEGEQLPIPKSSQREQTRIPPSTLPPSAFVFFFFFLSFSLFPTPPAPLVFLPFSPFLPGQVPMIPVLPLSGERAQRGQPRAMRCGAVR